MLTENTVDKANGILAGITSRRNPLSRTVHMMVQVNGNTIRVPIDHRQVEFIRKEYGIGSMIELQFYDGYWHAMSRIQPSCDIAMIESNSLFNSQAYDRYKH